MLPVVLRGAGGDGGQLQARGHQGGPDGGRTAVGDQPALGLEEGRQLGQKFKAPELGAAAWRKGIQPHQVAAPLQGGGQAANGLAPIAPEKAIALAQGF